MLLKLFHRIFILGVPLLLKAPFNVEPYSTYLNFKLNELQVSRLTEYVKDFDDTLQIVPIQLSQSESPDYYLSINIYNVTSPLFVNKNIPITRCELNTYVKDLKGNIGTLILDYCSNGLSIDPVNLIKLPSHTYHQSKLGDIHSCGKTKEFEFLCEMNTDASNVQFFVSDQLHKHTDRVYYKNGIYDGITYDNSLLHAKVLQPEIRSLTFKYIHTGESSLKLHSAFYFTSKLDFLCTVWNNFK